MIDSNVLGRALKTTIATGKVVLGTKETLASVDDGTAKMVIVAKNCPEDRLKAADLGVKAIIVNENNKELGSMCGKPFAVSALAVLDKGSSNIMTLG